MNDTVRLAKRVAEQLGCSRTQAEQYIEGGCILVDQVVVEEPGARVAPGQHIVLEKAAEPVAPTPMTILFHKPAGLRADALIDQEQSLITAATLFAEHRSGLRFLRRHARALTLTNPLEDDASGLLVLTQDWRIVRKLQTESARIEQEFVVDVTGTLPSDGLVTLQQGIRWNGKPPIPLKASWQSERRLRIAMKGAERGMLAAMCFQAGIHIGAIKRIRLGRVPLATLPVGQWRYLLGYEKF